jgi:hypothetical protein
MFTRWNAVVRVSAGNRAAIQRVRRTAMGAPQKPYPSAAGNRDYEWTPGPFVYFDYPFTDLAYRLHLFNA